MKKFSSELTKSEQKQLKGGFETIGSGGGNGLDGGDCTGAWVCSDCRQGCSPGCKDGCQNSPKNGNGTGTGTGIINPNPGDIGIGGGGIIRP